MAAQKTFEEFKEHVEYRYPNEDQQPQRDVMFLFWENKPKDEGDYMWKLYPNDNQFELRQAVYFADYYLKGSFDVELKHRAEIAAQIQKIMNNKL